MSGSVVIVGNAPLGESLAALVDGADHVVRCNGARGFGSTGGTRTDELYLVNHGGQMAEWLAGDELLARPVVAAAATLVLPIPMLEGHVAAREAAAIEREGGAAVHPDRINHLAEAEGRLAGAGHAVERVGVDEYRAAQRALATFSPSVAEHYPSTGFIAVFRALARTRPGQDVTLCGFTFEGWRGHSWDAERRWVAARIEERRLSVRPVRRARSPFADGGVRRIPVAS